jgi:hypothetical protein
LLVRGDDSDDDDVVDGKVDWEEIVEGRSVEEEEGR